MPKIYRITEKGELDPLHEPPDFLDRFLSSLYRSSAPETQAWCDFVSSEETKKRLKASPLITMLSIVRAIHTTGLDRHVLDLFFPFISWMREVVLDTIALSVAPLSFTTGFVFGSVTSLESNPTIHKHDLYKLPDSNSFRFKGSKPKIINIFSHFGIPFVAMLHSKSILSSTQMQTVIEPSLKDSISNNIVNIVAAYQGFWSALRVKKRLHQTFFGVGRELLDLCRDVTNGVVKAQNTHVTQRTRKRVNVAFNCLASSWVVWRFFWFARHFRRPSVSWDGLALLIAGVCGIASFHYKNGLLLEQGERVKPANPNASKINEY